MQIRHGTANEAFADWIGKMSYDPTLYGCIQLPDKVNQLESMNIFVDTVFPSDNMKKAHIDPTFFASCCILLLRSNMVSELNAQVLDHLQGN